LIQDDLDQQTIWFGYVFKKFCPLLFMFWYGHHYMYPLLLFIMSSYGKVLQNLLGN